MSWERYSFTDDFQEALIACLIARPNEFHAFGDIVKPEFFNGITTTLLVQSLADYEEKYGRWPKDFTILGNFAHATLLRKNPQAAEEILELCVRLSEVDTDDWEGVRDLAVNFAKERAVLQAVKKIHYATTSSEKVTIDPVQTLQDALAVGTKHEDVGINLYDDYEETIRKIYGDAKLGISTGYALLDKIWKTGWLPGWCIAILAPPKRFKTTFCINLAANMCGIQGTGGDIIYYACEINQELAAIRAMHNMTGWSEEDVINSGVEKFIQLTGRTLKKKMRHHIWLMTFRRKAATMSEIAKHTRYLTQQCNIKPRVIIIDYAETVKPSEVNRNDPEYRRSAEVFNEAKGLAEATGTTVIMPDRSNAQGFKKKVLSMDNFQGSVEKGGIVDAGISLSASNAEVLQKKLHYFVFLNRHGPAYQHMEGKIDAERYRMTIDTETEYDESLEEEDTGSRGKKFKRRSGEEIPPSLNALVSQQDR